MDFIISALLFVATMSVAAIAGVLVLDEWRRLRQFGWYWVYQTGRSLLVGGLLGYAAYKVAVVAASGAMLWAWAAGWIK